MQRYIATSVQRRDSNISMNWGMVNDVARVLLSVFSSFFWRRSTKTAKRLARRAGGATTEMG
jgi:hypothetical protein